jgi:hypothetical protein
MTDENRPLYYLRGKTIHRRPVERKYEGGSTISIGFPVCTVSEYADEAQVLALFNEHAS